VLCLLDDNKLIRDVTYDKPIAT